MSEKVTRMEVNAAIEKLIARSEDSEDAARVVIQYGDTMRTSGAVQIESTAVITKPRGNISGYSPGHGNVTIKDEEETKEHEFVLGVHKDRVGYYRLWKEFPGLLCFHRFWKSSIVTKGTHEDGPDVYRLSYDSKSLESEYLGIERSRVTLNLGILKFRVNYLEPVIGTIRKTTIGFGISIG